MTEIGKGDGAGLLAFTDWLYNKNEAKPATAKALKAAVARVLAMDKELLATQVSSFDLDQILTRFENGNRADFTSSSMETYKSRFRALQRCTCCTWLETTRGVRQSRQGTRHREDSAQPAHRRLNHLPMRRRRPKSLRPTAERVARISISSWTTTCPSVPVSWCN
jgi:hypothetical protein